MAGPLLAAAADRGRGWAGGGCAAASTPRSPPAPGLITVLAPPQVDPAGGEALWGHLTGLLRPPWARLWHGQPHLGFEYTWAGGPVHDDPACGSPGPSRPA